MATSLRGYFATYQAKSLIKADGDEMRRELESQRIPLFMIGIRRFVAYQKAALAGVPVYQANDPRAAEAWGDYLSLGKEILP